MLSRFPTGRQGRIGVISQILNKNDTPGVNSVVLTFNLEDLDDLDGFQWVEIEVLPAW